MPTIDEDPISYLDELMDHRQEERENAPVFPGTTPPRNTATTVTEYDNSWLWELPFQEYLIDGQVRKLYTIGSLAKAVGKKAVTIRSWEQKGWLPAPRFRTAPPVSSHREDMRVGRRLYTWEQLLFLVEAHQKYVLDQNDWGGFISHIDTHYPRD